MLREKSLSGKQGIRMWISGYQSIRLPDIRGTGTAWRLSTQNKIGVGSALILSLRNFRENPKRFNVERARKRDSINSQSYFALRFLRKACPERSRRANPPNKSSKSVAG